MTFSRNAVLGSAMILAGQVGQAQQLSPAEISAMVDQRMGAVDEYSELLNDPDPDRSLAAMQIMIGLDDPQISRMALQYGLTSTSAPVRKAALSAYLDAQPNIELFFDGTQFDLAALTARISNAGGTVTSEGIGFLTYRVGAFDESMACYVYADRTDRCFVKLSEETVIVAIWGRSAPFRLNAEGVLEGEVLVDNLTPAAPTTMPIRP